MGFVLIGIVLVVLKLAEIGPVGGWSWWWVASPFGAAIVWWWVADATGITQRRVMREQDERVRDRRERMNEALGVGIRRRKR